MGEHRIKKIIIKELYFKVQFVLCYLYINQGTAIRTWLVLQCPMTVFFNFNNEYNSHIIYKYDTVFRLLIYVL